MASGFDFKRLRKFVMIYTIVQVFFAILLVVVALQFQQVLASGLFMRTTIGILHEGWFP